MRRVLLAYLAATTAMSTFQSVSDDSEGEAKQRYDALIEDTKLVSGAEAVAVLLSKQVLHAPGALVEIYQATKQGKTIVPILILGRGYVCLPAGSNSRLVSYRA